jgi:chromatin segregation and condensation protein Rec8/ScpA/Scc1 (kleisin family)
MEESGGEHELQCRAAVASTLVAGLELARAGDVCLDQHGAWQSIRVAATVATWAEQQ